MRFRLGHLAWFSLAVGVGCGGDDDASTDTGTGDSGSGSSTVADGSPTGSPTTTPGETGDSASATGSSTGAEGSSSGGGDSTDGGSTGTPADSSTGAAACTGTTFFATSVGSGDLGGNLGGLAGADAICQKLAAAVGQGGCTWHAYLSTADEDARDRIGPGPWVNANGDEIAADVATLHTEGLSNGNPQHVLDENGVEVPGSEHDILTGSQEDGTYMADSTCADWTSDAQGDQARVGHSDIPGNPMFSPSWNSAHDTPGCRPQDLDQTGGAGRIYCFAID